MEFTDRYQALGIPYPDPSTVCKGYCEGTGVVPVYVSEGDRRQEPSPIRQVDESDPELARLWHEAEAETPADDGYHFVKCPTCKGTGQRA